MSRHFMRIPLLYCLLLRRDQQWTSRAQPLFVVTMLYELLDVLAQIYVSNIDLPCGDVQCGNMYGVADVAG